MAAITIYGDYGAPKIKSDAVSTVSPSISHEVMEDFSNGKNWGQALFNTSGEAFLVSSARAQHWSQGKHCSSPFPIYLLSPPHQTQEGSAGAPSCGSASSPFLSPRASGSNFYFFTAICFTSLFFFPIPSFLFLNYPQPEGFAICRCKNLREIWK